MSIAPTREHVEPDRLTARDLLKVAPCTMHVAESGTVTVGGVDLLDIVREYGTALYVYDEEHLRRQLRSFVQEFSRVYPQSSIVYAAKAFCSVATDKIVAEEGCLIDAASGGELAFAQAAGVDADSIFAQGNNKTPAEIAECVQAGVARFVVDTHEELERIDAAAAEAGTVQKVIVRVCPGIEADTHAYIQTANEDSKFGFNIRNGAAAEATKLALSLEHVELTGFHCHIGSQIFELESYREAVRVMFEFLGDIRNELSFTARELDMGGGLGIAYTVYDQPATVGQYATALAEAIRKYAERHDYPLPHLYVEPGRSIVANAGFTLYTVGSVKEVPGICTYVAVDGGMTDNIRTALYGSKYEAFVVEHALDDLERICDVVGKHCESGDVIVKNSPLQETRAGEHICVLGTGAYCNEMASNYNKQVRPGVVLVKDGQVREIVRRETYEDLLARELG